METLAMSKAERRRLEVMSQVKCGKMVLGTAVELLGLSYRQVKRLWSRYQSVGDAGLVPGLRGRKSNRQGDAKLRKKSLAWYVKEYRDYGPTLAAESLAEEGLVVPVQTLRRWLLAEGLWTRQRRVKVHRRRRERKEHFGEMVQMDGSHHDWFEGRGEKAVLMVMIDDATGRVYARFFEEETPGRPSRCCSGIPRDRACRERSMWTGRGFIAVTASRRRGRYWREKSHLRSLGGRWRRWTCG